MENISEEERDIIKENWSTIKFNAEKNSIYENTFNELKIKAIDRGEFIELILEKDIHCRININKRARIIKLKYYIEKKENTREELIYSPKNISFLTKHYNMEHPVYQEKVENETLNISADAEKAELIFNNPNITEIFDDKFDLYINEKNFRTYKNKIEMKCSDYYDEFSKSEYSKKISNDKILMNKTRSNIIDFITTIDNDTKYKIIFLIGNQKIGLTFTIKSCLKYTTIFYINIEDLHNIKKTSDKRKYLYYMLFNIFNNYSEYNNFTDNHILEIKGYDDILNVLTSVIKKIKENLGTKNVIVILDNYDDNLVGGTKLSKKYIEELYKIIQTSNIHIIFLGRGIYISDLLVKYFYKPYEIEDYILFQYYISLDLNIENDIHKINNEKGINEVEQYYINKYKNKEFILYNFILLKNFPEIVTESYEREIPFQFFKFQKEKQEIKIDFQHEDLLEANNKKIREYFAIVNNLKDFQSIKNPKLKGIIFEELIATIFLNNKSFSNLKFPEKNILEVEEIYNMKNIIPHEEFVEGPILILQKKEGAVFDFGFVFKKYNIDYFVGVQVGINKNNEDISNYCLKLELNEKRIISDISKLTKRNIKELRFIIILNLETQEELKKEYDKIYSEINKSKNSTNYEKNELEEKRAKLNHFNSKYGIVCCQNANISYYLFSVKEYCFLQKENEKIEYFDIDKINLIKKGFDNFCRNEYHLVPIEPELIILNEEEKDLLKKNLKSEIFDIEDINIDYKINEQLPLLIGTPLDCGILSITKDIKLFTYFNEKFTHFLIKKGEISKYEQSGSLFDFEYNSNSILSRYFVKFSLREEKKDEENKKNTDNKSEKTINIKSKKKEFKGEETFYKNNLRFLQRKRHPD